MTRPTSNNKISSLVGSQVPFFVRNEHGNFVTFLEKYYEYLEQNTKTIKVSKDLLNYQDIDLTEDDYADILYDTFLKYIPNTVKADKKILIKNIKDFYRAKGTEKSVNFLLRILGNTGEVDFYYPKKDVLRASDGKWFIQRSLRIDDIRIEGVPSPSLLELQKFIGLRIEALTTGTTAIVESVDRFFEQESLINELILSNIDGKFRNSEVVEGFFIDENGQSRRITAVVYNFVIDQITITNQGTNYEINDPVIILSETGSGACVFVSSVSAGEVIGVNVSEGGAGYRVGDTVVFDGPLSRGVPALANVKAVHTDEKVHPNTYLIDISEVITESNTIVSNATSNVYETFAYGNLATQFVTVAPNTTNLSVITSETTKIILNRIGSFTNVAYNNNSPIIISGKVNLVDLSSNLSTNTINVFPGYSGNIVSRDVFFYTSKVFSNVFANVVSSGSSDTIELKRLVLTPNTSNLKVSLVDVANNIILTDWVSNSNIIFGTGYSLNINNRTVLVTASNANSSIIKISPSLFGELTDNNVVVFEISYVPTNLEESNVFITTGNTISLNAFNVYVKSSSPTSDTLEIYPNVSSNLMPVVGYANVRLSDLDVVSAYADTIRFHDLSETSNVPITLYDRLNVNNEIVTISSIIPGSNAITVVPGLNYSNSNTSGIVVIRPPFNATSNLTLNTNSGLTVTTATLSDIISTSNVFFETYDSLNVEPGIVVTVTSTNTVSNTITISPGLPGNLEFRNFAVIKKPNNNTAIGNSLIYLSYANTGPIKEVQILNPGGYIRPPTVAAVANTRIFSRGILGSLKIIDGGLSYNIGDEINFENVPGGIGLGAKANVTNVASNGMITQVNFVATSGELTGGSGYDLSFLPKANVISMTGFGANVVVTGILGSGARMSAITDKLGAIREIFITSRGAGYEDAVIDLSQSGDGKATGNVTVVAGDIFGVFAYPGRYLNDDGFISSYNFLQDRDYYQPFSYVVKSTLSTLEYRKAIEDLVHPAGAKMFGEYMFVDEPANTTCPCDVSTSSKYITIQKPYDKIGNTINVNYQSHGLSEGNTVLLEFASGGYDNVRNSIYIIDSVITDYFEVIQRSSLKSITVNNRGRGYSNSYIKVNGDGKGANGYFNVNSYGSIVSVTITDFGINYTYPPIITANGSNIVMATFTSTLEYANDTSGLVNVSTFLV